jgi:hypothetical protein
MYGDEALSASELVASDAAVEGNGAGAAASSIAATQSDRLLTWKGAWAAV